jgi:hypothetical protein
MKANVATKKQNVCAKNLYEFFAIRSRKDFEREVWDWVPRLERVDKGLLEMRQGRQGSISEPWGSENTPGYTPFTDKHLGGFKN